MTKKRIRFTLIIIVAIALIFLISNYLVSKKQPINPKKVFVPVPGFNIPQSELTLPTGETMTVDEKEVKNVYNTGISTNNYGDVLFSETTDYQITYIRQGDYFLISILGSPFERAKLDAEKQFLISTGLDNNKACNIDVRISTPQWANPNETGQTYKLSFCQ